MRRSAAPLILLHLIGNALLLIFGYYWLGVNESDTAHLLWSVLVLLVGIGAALWIHGTALVFFDRSEQPGFTRALRTAGRNLLPLLAVALLAALIYGLLAYVYDKFEHNAFLIGSYATMHTRKPVAPAKVLRWYHVFIWILRWLVVPAFLFPLTAAVARAGWSGFHLRAFRRSRHLLYWIEVCLLLLLAIAVPLRLVNWVPAFSPFAMQMLSLLGRMGLGYLLFAAALLAIEFLTSRGRPRLSQPSTVPSP
jgi:hypothetical protein